MTVVFILVSCQQHTYHCHSVQPAGLPVIVAKELFQKKREALLKEAP